MTIEQFLYSTKGPRVENQDSLEIKSIGETVVACIADGVGGKDCGKIASSESIKFFLENISPDSNLVNLAYLTHKKIKEIQTFTEGCKGMATTFTACAIFNNTLNGVHIGDSRLFILRGNGIKQLTEDHTEVNRLIKSGKLKKEDSINYPRRNIIESALGIKSSLIVQNFTFNLLKNDRILLTTDGVHNVISKMELRDLSKKYSTIQEYGDSLVNTLNEKKLSDNASFILLTIF